MLHADAKRCRGGGGGVVGGGTVTLTPIKPVEPVAYKTFCLTN